MAPLLIERGRNFNRYHLGGRIYRSVMGEVRNRLSFDDESGLYLAPSAKAIDADTASWPPAYLLRQLNFGYTVNTVLKKVRIHPVRGHWNKYLEISFPGACDSMDELQRSDTCLELYHDNGLVRTMFLIQDIGFKIEILLRDGYTGNGIFDFDISLHDLAEDGGVFYDGGTPVLNLYNSVQINGDGSTEPIAHEMAAGVLTVYGELAGRQFPVTLDPTFSDELDYYGYTVCQSPTSVNCMGPLYPGRLNGQWRIAYFLWTGHGIPSGATVTSASVRVRLGSDVYDMPQGRVLHYASFDDGFRTKTCLNHTEALAGAAFIESEGLAQAWTPNGGYRYLTCLDTIAAEVAKNDDRIYFLLADNPGTDGCSYVAGDSHYANLYNISPYLPMLTVDYDEAPPPPPPVAPLASERRTFVLDTGGRRFTKDTAGREFVLDTKTRRLVNA